jgi:tetratricopeptide (TPR) repeat protein
MNLGLAYEEINQTAAAVSFFLRAAEYGLGQKTPKIVYTSLLKISECFNSQGGRIHSVTNALHQAIAYWPERPEGYFLLARFYERAGNWQECYTWASIGLVYADIDEEHWLPAYVGYQGKYCLEFEKAVSGWWIGRREESAKLFTYLLNTYSMTAEYSQACISNLERAHG